MAMMKGNGGWRQIAPSARAGVPNHRPGYDQIYPSPIYALPFRTEREGIRLKIGVGERLSCYFLS